mmetsp:Transcript_27588/g.26622  ORF Transcript_27588/g.26622 Transcript_27588/m.26622 type:complete len:174 (-) Transcript_27588:86-607(-)
MQEKIINERLANENIALKHRFNVLKMENEIVSENLGRLYESLEQLGNVKMVEDRLNVIIDKTSEQKNDIVFELDQLKSDTAKHSMELSDSHSLIKDLQIKVARMLVDKEKQANSGKETIQVLQQERDDAINERNAKVEELNALNKIFLQTQNEREKLRQRIMKLKKRRLVDLN